MKTLLIFDPHQNLPWVESILAKEEGNYDRLILGGDYFDTPHTHLPNVQQTAAWLRDLPERFGDRVTLLIGNHDVPYEEVFRDNGRLKRIKFACSGFTKNKARSAYKLLGSDWFQHHGVLHTWADGYLITHAGIHPHWADHFGGVEALLRQAEEDFRNLHRYSVLFDAGECRGGTLPFGGITWLDWVEEFVDAPELPPQIVGHTSRAGPAQKGRSWCLDGNQTFYGMLGDGALEVRFLDDVSERKEKPRKG